MTYRQPSQHSQKRAEALQQLQAKREKHNRLLEQQTQHQEAPSGSTEEEILDDFSSPEKSADPPSKPQASDVKPKGLSRLKPASVDSLTSSLNRMQLSGGAQQQRLAPKTAAAAGAAKPLPPNSSGSSSSSSSSQADNDDDDGASDNNDGPSSAESVEDSDEDAHPQASTTTNAARKLLPSSGGGQQGGLQETSKKPSVASDPRTTTASPDDLVLGERQQYRLGAALYRSLYTHQVEGVKWLWSLFAMGRGGILGDDMGLGKTMQCAAFLAGLLNSRLGKRAMVVAPKTLLMHWHKELEACGLGRRVHAFYGDSASERAASLNATGKAGGVLLTTYGMCLHNADALARPARTTSSLFQRDDATEEEGAFRWDMVILDEGHKVKNPKMKLVQQLLKIPSHIRVIISGTPIQNNLAELRNLMDFCCEGLLGCSRTFSRLYGKPITDGQDRNATAREREVGAAIAHNLRRKIAPYFLRREKKDVLTCSSSTEAAPEARADTDAVSDQHPGGTSQQQAVPKGLSRKNDLVVWLRLKPLQQAVYQAFLHSEAVKRALNETDSPLAALTVLKKTCDHPALLSEGAAESVLMGGSRWAKGKGAASEDDSSEESEDDSTQSSSSSSDSDSGGGYTGKGRRVRGARCAAGAKKGLSKPGAAGAAAMPETLMSQFDGSIEKQLLSEMESKAAEASCKSQFVLALLDELAGNGHRTLVFSQSRVMLDILQAGVKARGMQFCRIDGSIVSAEDRQSQVRRFQAPHSTIPVFLLTSQVGGLGLTLTAADRVVIVDPSWNPAVDNQAVDRAYRIGQARDVVVYRLITCGTVEEKIYSRQVFKGGLSRAGTEEGAQFRYFSQQQLRDLFTVTPEGLQHSSTQQHLHKLHAGQRNASAELQAHLRFLERIECYAGISDHDLLFSCKPAEPAPSDPGSVAAEYISRMKIGADNNNRRGNSSRGNAGSELQDMFGAAMRAHTTANATSGQQLQINAQRRKLQGLQARLASTQRTIATMGKMLPDGGSKLQAKLADDTKELAEANKHLQAMLGQPADGEHLKQQQHNLAGTQQQARQHSLTNAPQQQQQQHALMRAHQQKQQAFLQQQQQRAAGSVPHSHKQQQQQQQQQEFLRQQQQHIARSAQQQQERKPLSPLPGNALQPSIVQPRGTADPAAQKPSAPAAQTSQVPNNMLQPCIVQPRVMAEAHPAQKPSATAAPVPSALASSASMAAPSAPKPSVSVSSSASGAASLSFVTAGSLSSGDSPDVEVTSSFQPQQQQRQQQERACPVPFVDLT